jgi:hypothetical protein
VISHNSATDSLGKAGYVKRTFIATHWIYILAHVIAFLIGVICLLASSHTIMVSVGTSLIAGGVAGWVLFLHVWLSQQTAERLEIITQFGFVKAFDSRSMRIKTEYDHRLIAAKEHIDIMGFGLRALRQDYAESFSSWAQRATVRILLIDPEFPSSRTSLADQRDSEESEQPSTISNDVREFARAAAKVIARPKGAFQVRVYRCIPSMNLFRIDDDLFWGPYLVGQASRNSPTFVVKRGGVLYQRYLEHFEAIWKSDTLSRPIPPEWMSD